MCLARDCLLHMAELKGKGGWCSTCSDCRLLSMGIFRGFECPSFFLGLEIGGAEVKEGYLIRTRICL